ncbi:MAG: DUF262 domain-containing protein [Promethearchaeati archaeon SRVP18_Atabeyarchaeia-1]
MAEPYPKLEEALGPIREICEGKCVLPEFQRSFVWANPDIKSLLVSVLNGYFVGTLLFLRRAETLDFGVRYFEGVEKVNTKLPSEPEEKNVERAVLDGQQRLTALFYALYSPPKVEPKGAAYPIRYFVKVNERLAQKDWEDSIESISENDRTKNMEVDMGSGAKKYSFKDLLDWAGNFGNLLMKKEFKQYCYENGRIPFANLGARSELESWLEDFGDYISKKSKPWGEIKERKATIRNIFNHWFGFKIPSLTLENKQFYEVAEIFERINRTGVELSVFALATAVFFKQKINLRDWWKEYFDDTESEVNKFSEEDDEEYPKIILQIMALRQKPNPLEVKKKVLVNSKVFKIDKDNWNSSCSLLNHSLRRLQNTQTGYGVIRPNLLPYRPVVATLAAILEHCKAPNDFKKLDTWYWSSIFTERYAGASDTAIKQDFDQVRDWFGDNLRVPEVVKEAESRIREINLRDTSKGAIYKAILNLIALKGALDFYNGQSIELVKLNDHHLFPKKSGITLTKENSILNRTLIQESTNNSIIQNKKPSKYIDLMKQKLGSEEKVKIVLKTHLIEERAYDAMKNNNYDEFLKAREETIGNEMASRIKSSHT